MSRGKSRSKLIGRLISQREGKQVKQAKQAEPQQAPLFSAIAIFSAYYIVAIVLLIIIKSFII